MGAYVPTGLERVMMTTRADSFSERGGTRARLTRWLVLGLGVLVGLGVFDPGQANAYKRKLTKAGAEVFWKNPEVAIKVNTSCSADVGQADCLSAVRRALEVWNQADCSGFKFVFGGTVPRTDVGYDTHDPSANVNLVKWVEAGWDRSYTGEDAASILALTTRTFDGSSGEMLDADVVFNGQVFQFALLADAAGQSSTVQDIEGAMIHEAGHILGLDDLTDPRDQDSVMFAKRQVGEQRKRALAQDDVNGLCAIYPKSASDDSASGMTMAQAMGCSHVTPDASLEFFGLLIALGLGRRRLCRVMSIG